MTRRYRRVLAVKGQHWPGHKPRMIRVYRKAGAGETLGHVTDIAPGRWRFLPSEPGRRPSTKNHQDWMDAIPSWCCYPTQSTTSED